MIAVETRCESSRVRPKQNHRDIFKAIVRLFLEQVRQGIKNHSGFMPKSDDRNDRRLALPLLWAACLQCNAMSFLKYDIIWVMTVTKLSTLPYRAVLTDSLRITPLRPLSAR